MGAESSAVWREVQWKSLLCNEDIKLKRLLLLVAASCLNSSGPVKMRQTSCLRFATPVATGSGSGSLRRAPLALLPPIPLYRRLLRAHRHKLDPDERILGDQYIRSEFRAHRNVENPVHIVRTILFEEKCWNWSGIPQIGFLTEWQLYAQKLEGDSWKGEKMDTGKIDKMSGMPWFTSCIHCHATNLAINGLGK